MRRPLGVPLVDDSDDDLERVLLTLCEALRTLDQGADDHLPPASIVYVDADRRYRFSNRAYTERFGLEPTDIIGKRVAEVDGKDAYKVLQPHMEMALAGRRVCYEAEVPYAAVGKRYMRVEYVPDKDETGATRGFVGMVSDITERRDAEAETLRLNDERERKVRDRTAEPEPRENPRRLPIRTDFAIRLVRIEDIVHVEARDRQILVHTASGTQRAQYTLAQLEGVLPSDAFFRAHESHIIRLSQVEEILFLGNHSYALMLSNGSQVPVARKRYAELKSRLSLDVQEAKSRLPVDAQPA